MFSFEQTIYYSISGTNGIINWCVRLKTYTYIYYCISILQHNGTSPTKIVLASQARSINQYKNLRSKALKCCANIYFNLWPLME